MGAHQSKDEEKVATFVRDIGHPEWGVELTPGRRRSGSSDGIADEVGVAPV